MRILVANRGLSAAKFILSIRDMYTSNQVHIVGFVTSDDITSDYRYISQLDDIIYAQNDIYTNIDDILSACKQHNIHAVFPGWGYLSESADFAYQLELHNIIFMGPSSHTINAVGNKINSMKVAYENKVPLVKWSGIHPLQTLDQVISAIQEVGTPCVIKDADGGGGKGIRIVHDYDEAIITQVYNQINCEMKRNDGNSLLFVMELVQNCHHIEVQIAGDGDDVIHLHGRDCTCQRRNQKLIEEGPISVAPQHIITLCENSAVRIARAVNYKGLGTVEFLYVPETEQLTFLEINPRLQVEHVVTELLLNINLPVILFQLTCESYPISEIFSTTQFNVANRHIIAVRINAENPDENFQPSCGDIYSIDIPNVPQCWSYVSTHTNGKILSSVDSQFGHLFTIGKTRDEACDRMSRLIQQVIIDANFHNSLSFIRKVINSNAFRKNTHFTQ